MDTDKLKGLAGSASRLVATSAQLAKKQAELATLNNATLPKLYYSVGKRVARLADLPPELAPFRERIRSLEAGVAKSHESTQPALEETVSGFAAKAKQVAQQVAQKASQATANASAHVQIQAAYVACGKEAVKRFGLKAIPKELQADWTTAKDQIEKLTSEITELQAKNSVGAFTPRRLVLAGGSIAGVLLALFLLRSLGGFLFGSARPAFDYKQFTQDVMNSAEYKQMAKEANAEASRRAADISKSMDSVSEGLQEASRKAESDGNMAKMEGLMYQAIRNCEEGISQLDKQSLEESARAHSRNEKDMSALSDTIYKLERQFNEASETSLSQLHKKMREILADCKKLDTVTQKHVDQHSAEFEKVCLAALSDLKTKRAAQFDQCSTSLEQLTTLRKSLPVAMQQRLNVVLQRWEKEATSLKSTVMSEEKVAGIKPTPTATRFVEFEEQIRKELAEMVASRTTSIRESIDRCVSECTESLSAKDVADSGKAILSRNEKDVSEEVESRLAEVRERRLGRVDDLVSLAADVSRELAMQEQARVRAFEAQERRVHVTEELTDEELAAIAAKAPDLTHLDLIDCEKLTDKCFDSLSQLKRLRWLRLPNKQSFTASAFAKMRDLRFDYLSVPGCILNDPEGIGAFLRMHKDLASATMYNEFGCPGHFGDRLLRYGDAGLQQYEGMNIRGLMLPESGITDEGLRSVSKIAGLNKLTVFLTKDITDKGIAHLRDCKSLKELELLDNTKTKGLPMSPLSEQGIAALSGLGLDDFDIPEWLQTDKCLGPFIDALAEGAHKRGILEFNERDDGHYPTWPATAKSIQALAGKRGIRQVSFYGYDDADFIDGILEPLWNAPDLERVTFNRVQLTGKGLGNAGKASKLQSVTFIDPIKLQDKALNGLSQCEMLEELHISGAPEVTPEGLMFLEHCKSLRRVLVRGTKVRTSDGLVLENAVKGCRVIVE